MNLNLSREELAKYDFARALNALADEMQHAQRKFPPINSLHEGYGVIMEEVDEFFDEVKLQSHQRIASKTRKELLHVAVTALRTIVDLGLMGDDE